MATAETISRVTIIRVIQKLVVSLEKIKRIRKKKTDDTVIK